MRKIHAKEEGANLPLCKASIKFGQPGEDGWVNPTDLVVLDFEKPPADVGMRCDKCFALASL